MLQFEMVICTLEQGQHRVLLSFIMKVLSTERSRVSIIAWKVSVWTSKTSGIFLNLAGIIVMTLSMQS